MQDLTLEEMQQEYQKMKMRLSKINATSAIYIARYREKNLEKVKEINRKASKKFYDNNVVNEEYRKKKSESALRSYYKKKEALKLLQAPTENI
jgi:hypothetical protein